MSTKPLNGDRWADDRLGRQHDSVFLRDFLVSRVEERRARGAGRAYVLNLDAGWGQGKTYFLERFKQDLSERYSVAYVNAWEDDHADDPLIAMMIAIETALIAKGKKASKTLAAVKRASGKIAVTAAKHAAIGLTKRLIGQEGIDDISEAISDAAASQIEESSEEAVEDIVGHYADAALQKFEIAKETITDFKQKLSKAIELKSVRRPFFVLVDELDRCRPSYAIALLERVKHLFDIEDIVFVVATDTEQLRHAVSAIYGSGFDGSGYLLRFFDRTYKFATPDPNDFIATQFGQYQVPDDLLSSPVLNDHVGYTSGVAQAFKLSLREIERCMDVLRSAITIWPYQSKGARLELAYLLPLTVAYCRSDKSLFDSLARFDAGELQKQWAGSNIFLPTKQRQNGQPVRAGIFEPTQRLLERAGSKLIDIVNVARREEGVRGWVYDRFLEELNKVGSGVSPQLDGRSVLRTYPELVRSVGRLSGRE
ncbi:P-loop NTPase fold protein [Hyphomicrobium sp. CS1GBMeth3]|uniref:KAP family P-loop NTPase fold protein n=1 Tax=Hyphomicrobium sp. CS1GBMeth3 TaxID=1892845 RepID=UPI0009FB4F10|nr:P-loop NTPase fold protein [Hyphomicrobium sp. CS1GBMeth3]